MRVAFDEQPSDQDLQHFGVKGMKWGVRNYTDKNGRLTAEGREHYAEKSLTKPTIWPLMIFLCLT